MVEDTPPGDALPPLPQRATPARKGAHCGTGAGSPRPHRPHPGHTGRGTLAARSRGQAAGGGTAPDTRRPSQRWQATPPGTAPHQPRGTQPPQGMQAKGTVLGPHIHTTAPTARGWRTPTARPVGGQSRGWTAPEVRRPSQWWKAPPPGDALPPPQQRATLARKGARCGAGDGSPRPHQPHPGHTGRGAPAARSKGRAAGGGTAPDTRRPSQRWQATPPVDGPPPALRHATPTGHAGQGDSVGPPHPHTRAHSTWVADPNSPPSGGAVRGGTAPDLRRPSQWWKAPPPGTPFRHPHSRQRRPARAHAVGPVLGPHARNDRTQNTRVAEPWLPAPEDGRPGEGQRLTPEAPHNGGRPPPPGTAPPPSPRHAAPRGHASQGDSVGPPQPHTHAHSTWVADPNSPPSRRAVGGGTAPDLRRPSQWWKAPPPETPFRHLHSEQRLPARGHPVGPVLGPDARTNRTRDTRVAEPRLPAPEDGRPGEGQRLTPDAPHNGSRPPPPWTAPPPPPRHAAPRGHAGQGDSVGPPHPHTRTHSTWVADLNSPPSGRAVGGGTAPDLRRASQWWKAPPPGTPFRRPHSEQRRPARAHTVGLVLGPHARTDRTRDTRVAETRLPAPEDGQPGEGQRLTPGARHNGGRPAPPGTAPHHPCGTQPPQGMQAKGTVLGPHTHTPAPTARGRRTPTARPVGGQSGEGQRLT